MSAYVFLFLAFGCNAAANVFLKLGATSGFSLSDLLKLQINVGHIYTCTAVVLFAANLAFYLLALRTIPLGVGYPIMVGMTFVITLVASIFLGERITWIHLLGILLIVSGVFVIVRFAQV